DETSRKEVRQVRIGLPATTIWIFQEMRLAALLQRVLHRPKAMPARTVLEGATMGGARALGLDRELGSLEIGKRADIILVDTGNCTVRTCRPGFVARHSSRQSDVGTCLVDGHILMKDRDLLTMDRDRILRESQKQFQRLAARM